MYKAAYWGNKSDYLPNYPKYAIDPTIVLQFMLLNPNSNYNKEIENHKGNTPLHLASARGNLEAVRILMEPFLGPINKRCFILFQKLGYEHITL